MLGWLRSQTGFGDACDGVQIPTHRCILKLCMRVGWCAFVCRYCAHVVRELTILLLLLSAFSSSLTHLECIVVDSRKMICSWCAVGVRCEI